MRKKRPGGRGPVLPERTPKHRRKKGKKTFAIEVRYVGTGYFGDRNWGVIGRYERARDRDEALEAYRKRAQSDSIYQGFEYRKVKGEQSDNERSS